MIGKAAIAVVLIVAVSSTIGAFVLISSNSDGSENVVSYYDGNNKIGENREHTGSSISLLNSIESEERTLFGWSTLPNGGGTVYGPHSEFVLNGNITLYAMVADGKFTINGNNAEFEPASSARTDPLIIDLGYARGVTSVTVGSGILEKLNADDSSLRIEYYGGLVVLLDSVAVKGASVNGDLTVGFSTGITDTTEISIISGASGTQYKGSGVKAVVDSGPSYSVMKVFLVGSDGTETETVYSEADGKIQFDISGHPGFRTVELFKVDKENGNVQILPIYSNYFQKYGMFATGDVFKLSQTGGLKLSVNGATRSGDGNYVVSGKSSVSIGTSEKTGAFDIILPEEQIGYTLTSDQDSVPLGGNCIITYKRLSGYSDKELAVSVNGTIIALNGLGELHLSDIDEDQYITVEGVYDVREYNIIIPEKQVGYVLKTSVDRLHHGQSYTVTFELEPGYGKTSEFSIHIFGGVELNLSRGETLVKDVRGEHVILVDGVEIINYNVVAGKNTVLRVNGHAASTATIFDIVTIDPAFGYVLPSTFEDLFPNTVKKLSDGYKVSGNVNFPSVVKITVGENLIANGYSAGKSFDICSGDPVMVTAESGYSLSDNYVSRLSEISGKSLSGGKYTFSEDTILPSVFRVIYMGYDSELARYYIADGDEPFVPVLKPTRDSYNFVGWKTEKTGIHKNTIIDAIWSAIAYNVTFGDNLAYVINGQLYFKSGVYSLTVEDTISTIAASSKYKLPSNYFQWRSIFSDDTGYHVTGDNNFETVYRVLYVNGVEKFEFFFRESSEHTIVDPIDQYSPLFMPTIPTGKQIADFDGWRESGTDTHYNNVTISIHKDYTFNIIWV